MRFAYTRTLFSIQISFCILALTIVTRSHLSKRALRNPQASEDLTGFLLLLHSLKRYHTVTACSPSINTQIHTHTEIFNATRSGSSGTLPHCASVVPAGDLQLIAQITLHDPLDRARAPYQLFYAAITTTQNSPRSRLYAHTQNPESKQIGA